MAPFSRRGVLQAGLALGLGTLAEAAWAETPPPLSLRPAPRPGAGPAAPAVDAALPGEVSWMLIDAASGEVLTARAADRPAPPASTLKAVTALYALDRLGAGFRFHTRVLAGPDGLALMGGGDPVLDSDALAGLARVTAQAERTPAEFTVGSAWLAQNIAQIDPAQAVHLPYNPTISGLNLNFNRVHLSWRGGAQPVLDLQATGRRVSPRAYTVAVRAVPRRAPIFAYEGGGAREEWTVAAAALRQPGSRWLPVRRPALYAGDVFQTLARAEGLALPNPRLGPPPVEARAVADHASPPLQAIIAGMLEHSTNLTAEVLGLRASGGTDLAASAAAMADWVRAQGVPGRFGFADHSGLTAQSRVSAAMMARLLAGPGQRAGLAARLKPAERWSAEGRRLPWPDGMRVTAKTGTLNFVSNLVGHVEGRGGRRLVFAILCTDPARREAARGQELPAGAAAWVRQARHLQSQLLMNWAARFG